MLGLSAVFPPSSLRDQLQHLEELWGSNVRMLAGVGSGDYAEIHKLDGQIRVNTLAAMRRLLDNHPLTLVTVHDMECETSKLDMVDGFAIGFENLAKHVPGFVEGKSKAWIGHIDIYVVMAVAGPSLMVDQDGNVMDWCENGAAGYLLDNEERGNGYLRVYGRTARPRKAVGMLDDDGFFDG